MIADGWRWPLLALVVGFVIAASCGARLLPLLRRFAWRQHAYEDAPGTHRSKTGTPTMGGIVFVAALLPLAALGARGGPFAWELLLLVAACAVVGFADDYLSIRGGKNLGLRARTKLLLTALIAATFLRVISESTASFPRDVILRADGFVLQAPHWIWLLLGIVAITGTIHAVNLTDGLDGLAAGVAIPPALVLGIAAIQVQAAAAALGSFLLAGSLLGFLIYNRHPAKMFMGDTGSLAIGALLSGVAILSGEMLLLVLVGGVFVVEAVSVIMQVAYFKGTGGKRIFRMSPLHHHFELGGWPETKVTLRFWIASAVVSALGLAVVR